MMQRQQFQLSDENKHAASRIRHELQQPAAAMKLLLSRLEQPQEDGERKHIVETLLAAATELDRSSLAIADYMFLTQGFVERCDEDIDIAAFLKTVADGFRETAEKNGLVLIVNASSSFGRTDPALLERIVTALIENAVDFTQDGCVEVNLVSISPLEVAVSDTGVGLSREASGRCTAPFWTDQTSKARRSNRLGLGLSIAQAAAALLGGEVTVTANVDGPGATARFQSVT